MAKQRWSKDKIKSGNVISFTYNGKIRTVIVMECPNDIGRAGRFTSKEGKKSRFLHAIDIPRPYSTWKQEVSKMIKKMGGTRLLAEFKNDKYYEINFGEELKDLMNARTAYKNVKIQVDDLGMYKTFKWSKIQNIYLTNNLVNFKELINPRYKEEEGDVNED